MAFQLPDFIDEAEGIDAASDPLCILLAREGDEDEAYQTAMAHRAGRTQIVERALIEQQHEFTDLIEQDLAKRRAKAFKRRSQKH